MQKVIIEVEHLGRQAQRYLFDEPLAEGRSYPLPGVDATVDPHGLLLMTISLSYLPGHQPCRSLCDIFHVHLLQCLSYLEHIEPPPFVRLPDGEHIDQVGVGSVHFKHPALDLQSKKTSCTKLKTAEGFVFNSKL